MKKLFTIYLILAGILIGLPLLGIWISGENLQPYLQFPPLTHDVQHAPFSWPVFIGMAFFILLTIAPFLIKIMRTPLKDSSSSPARSFPWWGWASFLFGLFFWIIAWTRFPLFNAIQPYTFTPQWLAYIGIINALTYRKKGSCLLTQNPRHFLLLFPLSAAFWWFFEYLNRFVQNWSYTGFPFHSPLHYFISATLPFATVLPAILSTEEWLATHPKTTAGLDDGPVLKIPAPKTAAILTFFISAIALFLIGRFPDQLYPLLWVAPLLLILSFQTLSNRPAFFPELQKGDWRSIVRFALAALICGFFWELWNVHSLAKWIYSVPYVDRFHLFEMPLLGFAGYLPFGLECAVIAALLNQNLTSKSTKEKPSKRK